MRSFDSGNLTPLSQMCYDRCVNLTDDVKACSSAVFLSVIIFIVNWAMFNSSSMLLN